MVTYVLDTSALLRYIDNESGADRIAHLLQARAAGDASIIMSAINWGEITTVLLKQHGVAGIDAAQTGLEALGIDVISTTALRAERSARIKFQYGIPYADAFCVELAGDSADHVLITADFDMKPAAVKYRIEFLPVKHKT